jgi:hypothetical protein
MLPGLTLYASDSSDNEPPGATEVARAIARELGYPDEAPINIDQPAPIPMPLPSTEQRYSDPESAIAVINELARPAGYAVVKGRSKKTKRGVLKRVVLHCDRRGEYKDRISEESRKRQTNTRTCGCKFQITLRRLTEGQLSLFANHESNAPWILTIENRDHNDHEASEASTHYIHRNHELKQLRETITTQLHLQIPTRQIVTSIHEANPNSCIISADINNFRAKLSQEFLNGRTPVQALLMELPTDGQWVFRHTLDADNHVTVLFAMHKTSLEMLKHHPWVLSMDCTYKTNRYNMPLLDIIGFTCTGASFYLGWAFLANEREETYKIVLEYLAEMYQHIREANLSALGLLDTFPTALTTPSDIDLATPDIFPATPSTILTDKESGLINAIHNIFPDTYTMICIWHINMNLMKKALPLLRKAITHARETGLLEWDGLTLPSDQLTKRELDEALSQVLDEGWSKMMKR